MTFPSVLLQTAVCAEKGVRPSVCWSFPRERVTAGGAPSRGPWAPQGLPIDTWECQPGAFSDAGREGAVVPTRLGRAAHVRRQNDRVLDIARRTRKDRADQRRPRCGRGR